MEIISNKFWRNTSSVVHKLWEAQIFWLHTCVLPVAEVFQKIYGSNKAILNDMFHVYLSENRYEQMIEFIWSIKHHRRDEKLPLDRGAPES